MNAMTPNLCRILIVDDDTDTLANLSDILSDVGYKIDTAASGELALQKAKSKCPDDDCRYDLCLLDFKMPGMDGVELYTHLQKLNPKIRGILITAYAGDDGIQRAIDAGTWKVLRKPVDIQALLGVIGEAVA